MKPLLFLPVFLLAACGPLTPVPLTPFPPTPASSLVLSIHEVKFLTDSDSLQFTLPDGKSYGRERMGSGQAFAVNRTDSAPWGLWAMLGNERLVAGENYNQDGSAGWIALTRNGQEIYRLDIGPGSPVTALRGLWVYDGHWVLEVAQVTQHRQGNAINLEVLGQIVQDGVLLNRKLGYDEAFGFQTIATRPFYFFKRSGRVTAWYDGQEIPLDVESVSHYGCCSAAQYNPLVLTNMVAFFGKRGQTWYLVQLGTPGAFIP